MKIMKNVNYLNYIPKRSEFTSYEVNEKGNGVVKIENRGFYNVLARKLFKRPRYTDIELEEYGTFIWKYIDGKNTIYDIAMKVKDNFGGRAEPLYERICKYFRIMTDNKLIILENNLDKK